MAAMGKSEAFASSFGDELDDMTITIVDDAPKAAPKYKSKTMAVAAAAPTSMSRKANIVDELESDMAELDVLVKAGDVIEQLEKAAVKSGHVKGDDIDSEYPPGTWVRASDMPAAGAAAAAAGALTPYPCNGDCNHADGSGCGAACKVWKQQWGNSMALLAEANAFHVEAVRTMMPASADVALHTDASDDITDAFVSLYARSNDLNARSGSMNQYNMDVYRAKTDFEKHAYSVLCDRVAPAFLANRNAVKSQLRPLRTVARHISKLSRALLKTMGDDDWIASNATNMAEHIAQCTPAQWQEHVRTMEHTGEMLIETAQTMFRLAADAERLSRQLELQSRILEQKKPPLPTQTKGAVGNAYWTHVVQSSSISLGDLDIWGNVAHGVCRRGVCRCVNHDEAKDTGAKYGDDDGSSSSSSCCANCCDNCKSMYDGGGDKFKRSLRTFLDLQHSGNLLVYTGAVFFRDCYSHLQRQLEDDARRAMRISQGFSSLGEAMTQQHFVVLTGAYFLRLLNKPPATPSVVGGRNASMMPIDILQVLFGPRFVSQLDDNERLEIRMELANRGPALEGKLRTYLARTYIPKHMNNIQIAARSVFSTELETLQDILYEYNKPAVAAAVAAGSSGAADDAETRKKKQQAVEDAADMRELDRRHIESNLKEFRTLLFATVDYLDKQVPCTQHCECCPTTTKAKAKAKKQVPAAVQPAAAAAALTPPRQQPPPPPPPPPSATALTRTKSTRK